MKSRRRFAPLFPAVFFLLAYLLPIGFREMIRPDEFRYAEIPREMLVSGRWMHPRLDGVRYFEKPTLGYQLTALSMSVFGKNRFALRLPSVLGTLLAAAMVYLLCRVEFRGRFWPGMAVGIHLASALVLGVGTYAVLDAQFTGALTVCIGAVYLACRSRRRSAAALYLAAAGAAAAAAFMLKGFLAFVLPAAVAGPFLLWKRDWKKLLCFPWMPLAVVLLIALPWALAVHRAEPDFWRYFFIEEHWKRFSSGTYDRDPQPFWYFLPVLLGGILPAGFLWFAGVSGCTKKWFSRPFVQYMLCWFAFPFLLFSISSCKLGTYILPCFPPLAMLLASALRSAGMADREKFARRLARIFTAVGALAAAAGAIGTVALAAIPFLPDKLLVKLGFPLRAWVNVWSVLAVIALFVFGAALCRLRRAPRGAARWLFLTGPAPAVCFGMLAIPPAGLGQRTPEAGLRECLRGFPDHRECAITVERTCIAPVCWVTERDDIAAAGTKLGELKFGLTNYPDEYAAKHISEADLPAFVKARPGKVLYVTFYDLRKRPLPESWPRPSEIRTRGGVSVMRFSADPR